MKIKWIISIVICIILLSIGIGIGITYYINNKLKNKNEDTLDISIINTNNTSEYYEIVLPCPLYHNNVSEFVTNLKMKEGSGNITIVKINNSYGIKITSTSSIIKIAKNKPYKGDRYYGNVSFINYSYHPFRSWGIFDGYLLSNSSSYYYIEINYYSYGLYTQIEGTIKNNYISKLDGLIAQ